uniref:Right handed beta helix domain-containing protein n=1 Tax=Aureoumbra lagunensis TaxID=44058 RepID=A0A7S3JNW1_9STRA|mmetsp:Transcript_22767/g.29482  ORF Transcript_22767/g.29482 Transcript_22767/m.29482 type:complete len:622 (-) Transcript_22767:320-2185(-)
MLLLSVAIIGFLCGVQVESKHLKEGEINIVGARKEEVIISLGQANFDDGTLIIASPGTYVVEEDIVFAPKTDKMFPPADSNIYSAAAGYALGFFAAIAVTADDVTIDLNGHEIRSSVEFSLRQRFFSIIELANTPFLPGTGPPQFAKLEEELISANNFKIMNGVLGLSSHSGIHGNFNTGVEIRNVHIRDFETTGIQLNEGKHVIIDECNIGPALGELSSAGPVRALATLSQATFLLRMVERFRAEYDAIKSAPFSTKPFDRLNDEVEAFIARELEKGDDTFQKSDEVAFCNDPNQGYTGFMDGSAMYGILFNRAGVAVGYLANCNDVEDDTILASDLTVSATTIHHITLHAEEVQALIDEENQRVIGPDGGVIPIAKLAHPDRKGKYFGNTLSDAQFELQRIKNYYLEFQANLNLDDENIFERFGGINVPEAVLQWQKGKQGKYKTLDKLLQNGGFSFTCNEDCMAHSNKGVIGIRVEFSADVLLEDVSIHNLTNNGTRTNFWPDSCAGKSNYLGSDARGIVTSVSTAIRTSNTVEIADIYSDAGSAYGIEVRDGVSNTHIHDDLIISNVLSGIDTEHCHSVAVQRAEKPGLDIERRILHSEVVDKSALGCPFLAAARPF